MFLQFETFLFFSLVTGVRFANHECFIFFLMLLELELITLCPFCLLSVLFL